jgi:GAF domain-containing protein
MSKVTSLPGSGTLTVPVARGATVRLTPFRGSPHVLLELRGPSGGDLGALVLHVDNARQLADGLVHIAEGEDAPDVAAGDAGRAVTLLTASLDPEATLNAYARLAVPVFADWCTLDVADGDEPPRRVAIVHADAGKAKEAAILARYPHDIEAPHPRSTVWRTGEPYVAHEVTDDRLVAAARNAQHLGVLRSLHCRSSIAVPLGAGKGRVRAVMTFALAESRRRYDEADLPLALTVARCTALAAENAKLYREAHAALRPAVGVSPAHSSRHGAGAGRRTGV